MSRFISATQFKTRCLALLDEVADHQETFIITRQGSPIARVIPIKHREAPPDNPLKNSIVFEKDIVKPVW